MLIEYISGPREFAGCPEIDRCINNIVAAISNSLIIEDYVSELTEALKYSCSDCSFLLSP